MGCVAESADVLRRVRGAVIGGSAARGAVDVEEIEEGTLMERLDADRCASLL